jgi:hypothetical protein
LTPNGLPPMSWSSSSGVLSYCFGVLPLPMGYATVQGWWCGGFKEIQSTLKSWWAACWEAGFPSSNIVMPVWWRDVPVPV